MRVIQRRDTVHDVLAAIKDSSDGFFSNGFDGRLTGRSSETFGATKARLKTSMAHWTETSQRH